MMVESAPACPPAVPSIPGGKAADENGAVEYAREPEASSSKDSRVNSDDFLGQGPDFDALSFEADKLANLATEIIWRLACNVDMAQQSDQGPMGELISRSELSSFVERVSLEYNLLPFHNFYHAISVLQCVACLVESCAIFSKSEKVLLCLVAICHDINHVGCTNRYLCSKFNEKGPANKNTVAAVEYPIYTKGEISQGQSLKRYHSADPVTLPSMYGTGSPQEKHHIAITLRLLREYPGLFDAVCQQSKGSAATLGSISSTSKCGESILSNFTASIVFFSILCTDLAMHRDLVDEQLGLVTAQDSEEKRKLKTAALILHAADLSNAARSFAVNQEWSQMLNEERISREGAGVTSMIEFTKGEVFFGQAFILPTWKRLSATIGSQICATWTSNVTCNIEKWLQMSKCTIDSLIPAVDNNATRLIKFSSVLVKWPPPPIAQQQSSSVPIESVALAHLTNLQASTHSICTELLESTT